MGYMSNDLRRGRHVVYNLHVHLVFVAKYRRKVFTKEILDDMQAIFEEVCTKFEAQLVEFDGEMRPCAFTGSLSA
jgi:putative transposase